MSRTITVELREVGQNRGLFGTGRGRRVREQDDDVDLDDDAVDVPGDDLDFAARRDLIGQLGDAMDEAHGHLGELQEMHGLSGSEHVQAAAESRRRRRRPRSGWVPLTEARAKPRRASHWAGKLLGQAKASGSAKTWADRLLG
jgi:hypothetical protein